MSILSSENKELYDKTRKIQLDRIGSTCFYDTVSVSLEFVNKLYWALEYTHYKFLYNRDVFLEFKSNEDFNELLSKTDEYFFQLDPISSYRRALTTYDLNHSRRNIDSMLEFKEYPQEDFCDLIRILGKSHLPLILTVDTYAYRDFFIKHGFTVPRSANNHRINILDISSDGSRCYIFDRGFDCFGEWIDVEMLFRGATSSFLKNKKTCSTICFAENTPPKLDVEKIKELLVDNMYEIFNSNICINDNDFLNNKAALKAFDNDLEEIILILEKKYGNLAAALMGENLGLQVDGVMGLSGLYSDINQYFQSEALNDAIPHLRKYWEIWRMFEKRLQYITYGHCVLHDYMNSLHELLQELININEKIECLISVALKEIERKDYD